MLIDRVRQTIQSHDLIHKGDHIVLGLSGGPDSVCLFHVLRRLAAELELTIHPVHINHGFRPGAADQDQAYVEDLCAKTGLSCRVFTVDCTAMAKEQGMTSEEAGRKARYDAFVQTAREIAAAWVEGDANRGGKTESACALSAPPRVRIAVAQNANDQAETILHRIIRGTGTDGLSGIAYERMERGIPVIRPLLDVPRDEIEAYCEENDLHPVTDHTNNEPIYTRNKIRLEVLPLLEKNNPNIIETLTRLGRIAAADREYLWAQAESAFRQIRRPEGSGDSGAVAQKGSEEPKGPEGPKDQEAPEVVLDRAELALLPDAIRHRVISKAFGEVGLASDISEERLRAADAIISKKQAPKTVEFPRGHRLTVCKGLVIFR